MNNYKLQKTYRENYLIATKGSGRLMLVGGDHEGEFSYEQTDPEYLFRVASKANIGVFSTLPEHLLYVGMDYPKLPYVIRLNTQFDKDKEPTTIKELTTLQKKHGIKIVGVRYKISFGSQQEEAMIEEASRLIAEAHSNGLLAILWGHFDQNTSANRDSMMKAARTAALLNADFLKVSSSSNNDGLKEAAETAGTTKLVCAGGEVTDPYHFLQELHNQLNFYGTGGNATGRNIEAKPFDEAVRFCNAISALTIENKPLNEAIKIYKGNY